MKQKELEKYLKQTTWYHGTTLKGWKSICKYGVESDYNLGNELDFGSGFYLTPKYKLAESYITRNLAFTPNSKVDESLRPVVIEFELCLDDLLNDFNHKTYLHRDDEFVNFVILNRLNPDNKMHSYDFIIGVMSDSNPDDLIEKYKNEIISIEELKEVLKKWNSMEQLSLHNQNIGDY